MNALEKAMVKRCLLTATKIVLSVAGFVFFCMVGR